MSEPEHIYNNDTNLPLKSTTKRWLDSQRDINGELGKWGIKKIFWNVDLENNICELIFELPPEHFKDAIFSPAVRLTPPYVWKRPKRGRPDEIDWRLSFRLLYWYIHYQLAWTYANQSSPVVAFLPHIKVNKEQTVAQMVIPQMSQKALPKAEDVAQEDVITL